MTGKIVRLIPEKGFGFINVGDVDYFFHRSSFDGHWQDLEHDLKNGMVINVGFDIGESHKGPRAENVKRLDWPNQ